MEVEGFRSRYYNEVTISTTSHGDKNAESYSYLL